MHACRSTLEDPTRTAERYLVTDKVDRNLTAADYAFVVGEYEKDLFGPLRNRTSEAVGYGRHVMTGPVHTLDAEIGAGARQSTENKTHDHADEAIGRFSGKYVWAFRGEGDAFSEALKVEGGESNIYSESVTELRFMLVGHLAAAASFAVRNNSDVPPGIQRTDTTTMLSLNYSFGQKK